VQARIERAARGELQIERAAVVVVIDLARLGPAFAVVFAVVIQAAAQMRVVEVQTVHLVAKIVPFVHVRGAGHQAESQVRGTTGEGYDTTHPGSVHPSGLLPTPGVRLGRLRCRR